ncbi:hypothetical protein AKJ48_04135 [candidate division MSBL1 archaeon SCGC-AAA261O19]|uniref:FAD/NAD(P)-binding domain-containing protein n=1 Tax=candidate division MSBL1 archaeon SCGC-AAA261O19 TaxID=1698277 RepID=A0A133V9V3_9EURY|nr:hypothetical protein AKJ48_04135 [candidate division MSBL1 archaeon SCGC-AAA261O19]
MPENYDVVVAGGGPAGLAAARVAASEGGKVLLLELQAQIGGQTQSAAWIPSELIDDTLEGSVIDSVQSVVLRSPHRELEVEGDFGVIVNRGSFDKLLAAEAAKEGVEIWVGSPVRGILEDEKGVYGVRAEAGGWSESIECGVVIDATGARGQWSSLFLREIQEGDWDEERMTRSNEYLMANARSSGEVELYFNSLFAPLGHAWIYPFGQNFVMSGIRGARIHPDAALDEFIGREEPEKLVGSSPIAAFRGQLPLSRLESACENGIMSVGSAAGQVHPLSGHGVGYALEAGETAGETAVDAITEGDTSRDKLREYEQRCQSKFGRELQAGEILQEGLQTAPDRKMDALLEILDSHPDLQEEFVNVFLSQDLEASLGSLLKNKEVEQIFGQENTRKILALYS